MVSDRAFIFNISFLGVKPFLYYKIKVICQGQGQISRSQFSKKNGGCGGLSVSLTRLVQFETVQNSSSGKWLTLSAANPCFYVSAVQVF